MGKIDHTWLQKSASNIQTLISGNLRYLFCFTSDYLVKLGPKMAPMSLVKKMKILKILEIFFAQID